MAHLNVTTWNMVIRETADFLGYESFTGTPGYCWDVGVSGIQRGRS